MTPKRAADLVERWVALYTRQLPDHIAERRSEEICADIEEHIVQERAVGTSDQRIALSICSRMIRGMTADVSWSRRIRPLKGAPVKRLVSLFATVFVPIAIGLAAMVLGEADDAPGLVLVGILFIVGAILFAVKPAQRTRSRVAGFILGAIAFCVVAVGIAGWLENTV